MKVKKYLVSVLCLIFGLSAKAQSEFPQPDSTGYIVRVGDMAPDFTVKTTSGKEITLSSLRGKVILLQFTASWCGVCRKEMPYLNSDIYLKHKDNPDFVMFGIDRDEPLATVQNFAKQTGINYPLALDPGADVFAKYALREAGITRNVLIDREGRIVMTTRLYNPKEFLSLVEAVTRELNDTIYSVNVGDFNNFVHTGDAQILDARTAEEYAAGHIPGAINIDVLKDDFLTAASDKLDKHKKVYVYCRSGKRSMVAASKLATQGYRSVNLKGGYMAWSLAEQAQ